jgi:hypothetical protein
MADGYVRVPTSSARCDAGSTARAAVGTRNSASPSGGSRPGPLPTASGTVIRPSFYTRLSVTAIAAVWPSRFRIESLQLSAAGGAAPRGRERDRCGDDRRARAQAHNRRLKRWSYRCNLTRRPTSKGATPDPACRACGGGCLAGESAGIKRHGEGDERALHRRPSSGYAVDLLTGHGPPACIAAAAQRRQSRARSRSARRSRSGPRPRPVAAGQAVRARPEPVFAG